MQNIKKMDLEIDTSLAVADTQALIDEINVANPILEVMLDTSVADSQFQNLYRLITEANPVMSVQVDVSANAYQRAFNYQVTRTTSGLDIFAGENGGSAMKIATLGALEIDGLKLYVGGITTSAADQPNFGLFANNLAVIPEPSSAGLLLTGLASWLACRRRRISS